MKNRIRSTLLIVLLGIITGCTSMQELPHTDRPLSERLRTGDHIIVYTRTGRIIDMRYVLIEDDVIRGSLFFDGLEPVEVRLDEIEKIEAERVAAGRTAAAVLGGIVLAPIAAVGAGMVLAEQ